jgi:hypothetical protein
MVRSIAPPPGMPLNGRATLPIGRVYLNPQPAPQQFAIETFGGRPGQSARVGVIDPVVSVKLDSHRHADVGDVRLCFYYDIIRYSKLHLQISQNVRLILAGDYGPPKYSPPLG